MRLERGEKFVAPCRIEIIPDGRTDLLIVEDRLTSFGVQEVKLVFEATARDPAVGTVEFDDAATDDAGVFGSRGVVAIEITEDAGFAGRIGEDDERVEIGAEQVIGGGRRSSRGMSQPEASCSNMPP